MCEGADELRGGGGRLGGWDLRLCRGGRGSLSSADMSSRSALVLSMAPSAGDGKM